MLSCSVALLHLSDKVYVVAGETFRGPGSLRMGYVAKAVARQTAYDPECRRQVRNFKLKDYIQGREDF